MFRFARLLGEFRFHFVQELRRRDAAAAMNDPIPGGPDCDSPSPRQQPWFPIPLSPLAPSPPLGNRLSGSPMLALVVTDRDVECDGDRERELRMRARGGRDKRAARAWRRRAMSGGKRGLIASSAARVHELCAGGRTSAAYMNGRGWLQRRSNRSRRGEQQQRDQYDAAREKMLATWR